VFCPNCGTQQSDGPTSCTKCNFPFRTLGASETRRTTPVGLIAPPSPSEVGSIGASVPPPVGQRELSVTAPGEEGPDVGSPSDATQGPSDATQGPASSPPRARVKPWDERAVRSPPPLKARPSPAPPRPAPVAAAIPSSSLPPPTIDPTADMGNRSVQGPAPEEVMAALSVAASARTRNWSLALLSVCASAYFAVGAVRGFASWKAAKSDDSALGVISRAAPESGSGGPVRATPPLLGVPREAAQAAPSSVVPRVETAAPVVAAEVAPSPSVAAAASGHQPSTSASTAPQAPPPGPSTHGARAAARNVAPASRGSVAPSGADPIVRDVPWDEPAKATGEAAGSEAEPSAAERPAKAPSAAERQPTGPSAAERAPAQTFDPPNDMPK
jgi:hypothetical protein